MDPLTASSWFFLLALLSLASGLAFLALPFLSVAAALYRLDAQRIR